jgi:hypothetical protein
VDSSDLYIVSRFRALTSWKASSTLSLHRIHTFSPRFPNPQRNSTPLTPEHTQNTTTTRRLKTHTICKELYYDQMPQKQHHSQISRQGVQVALMPEMVQPQGATQEEGRIEKNR